MDFTFFDPRGNTDLSENRLPHWQQSRTLYFVTFRLADALPAHLLRGWTEERKIWLSYHPTPWSEEIELEYHRRFSTSVERWIDQALGECLLRDSFASAVVGKALNHFNGTRYEQLCWVVMPNHVHLLCAMHEPWTLAEVIHSWKSFTSHALNKLLTRSGAVWQKDYFDRIVRSDEHFWRIVKYIRQNPTNAKLRPNEYLLWEHPEIVLNK